MSNEEDTPANFTIIQSTDDWNNFLERVSYLLSSEIFLKSSDYSRPIRRPVLS